MLDSLKRFWLALIVLLCGGPAVFGFSLLGPVNEAYQVPVIGYNLPFDIGAPKNFAQGYRWNTPTNYYAYDDTFLEYFGSNGIVAVDAAFASITSLPNASQIDLNQWPVNSSRVNHRAQELSLIDLKSYTMSVLIEQLGLAEPDRYTWSLHDRFLPPGAQCPAYEYLIIQRNFDPFTTVYSSFVNGVFYDYYIFEICPAPGNPQADAIEVPVDPVQQEDSFSAVAAYSAQTPGVFYLGYTRDDVGGLKYLYSATNAFEEQAETNSLQIVTNQNVQLLVTQDLGLFSQQALTNTPAALQALYPGLVITATTNFFTNVVSTNVTAFLTNPPFAPAGTIQLVFATNFTTNVQQLFFNTYANLQIVHAYPKGFVSQQTISLQPVPFGPAGTFKTNVSTTTSFVKFTNGDFYILPTNLCGPFQILATQLVQVIATTNFIPISTNSVVITTNSVLPVITSVINYFTNYSLLVHEVDCATNAAALREGIEHISFVRRDFDSLLGVFWTPVTNIYQITAITNGVPVVQTFRRVLLTAPDFLLAAQDETAGPAGILEVNTVLRTVPQFIISPAAGAQAGPGTMGPTGRRISYNDVGPIYENVGPFFVDPLLGGTVFFQTNSIFIYQWGSFDGTTNDPIVYPSTTSIAGLEAQLFFQVSNGLLPVASVSGNGPGNAYNVQLQATGGSPPYTWSLATNSAGLPPGLTLSSSGVISGSPTTPGIYDFTVQATDLGARVAQRDLFIEVDP